MTAAVIDTSRTGVLARALAKYYLGPDHVSKLRLWRWLYGIFGRPSVIVSYMGGARLRLDYSDYVQSHILRFGVYEPEVWDVLGAYAVGNDIVWDVGAHVGSVSIRAALDPRVRSVHGFEPNPDTIPALRTNFALNPNLSLKQHAVALGDRQETRRLWPGTEGNIGTASLMISAGGGAEIFCIRGDELVASGAAEPPTLMKIDVEGFELKALAGCREMLASGRVRAIVFESEADKAGRLCDRVLATMLASQGYQLWRIARPGGSIEPRENYLAARNLLPGLIEQVRAL